MTTSRRCRRTVYSEENPAKPTARAVDSGTSRHEGRTCSVHPHVHCSHRSRASAGSTVRYDFLLFELAYDPHVIHRYTAK